MSHSSSASTGPSGVDALVLRLVPYRDADLIVTLLSDDVGVITGIARGGRRSKRRFAGALSLFVLGRYQVSRTQRGDMWQLDSGESIREWSALAGDLGTFSQAGYALELIRELAPPGQPEPALLTLTTALFDRLLEQGATSAALRGYELAILDATGHAPVLEVCVACGTLDLANRGAIFDPRRGGVVCRRCAIVVPAGGRAIDEAVRQYLLATTHESLDGRTLDESTPSDVRSVARAVMADFMAVVIGHPLKTVEFVDKLAEGLRRPTR